MAIAIQPNSHGWNIKACLMCCGVKIFLSRFIGLEFNAEQAVFIFWFYVCLDRYEIKYDKEDYVLRVKKASVNDEGTFTCLTENRVGKLEASATLTVRGMKRLCSFFHINWYVTTEAVDYWKCTSVWGLESYLHKWKFRLVTPAATWDVDTLWMSLIIYVSKCGVGKLCPPTPSTPHHGGPLAMLPSML